MGGCCVGLGNRRKTTGSKCSQPSSCRAGLFLLLCRQDSALHLAAPSPRPRVPPQSRRNGHPCPLSSQALRLSEARDARGLSQVRDGGESGDLLREGACTGRGGCQGLTKNPDPPASAGFSECRLSKAVWPGLPQRQGGSISACGRGPVALPVGRVCFGGSCGHPGGLCGLPSPEGMSQERQCFCMGGTWARAPHWRPPCEQCRRVL